MKLKLVTVTVLAILAGSLLWYQRVHSQPTPVVAVTLPAVAPKPAPAPPALSLATIASLTNDERTKAGLAPLTEDARLDRSAQAHCADMVRLNEWGHYLSDGTTPQTFISQVIPNWYHSGENTTRSWNTAESVMSHLMASPEHRANILNPDFTLVGYATCSGGLLVRHVVVQQFVGF